MSIDLEVFVARVPKDLKSRWQDALAEQGMVCELRPDFDPATWTGSDLVAKVQIDPGAFHGAERYGTTPFLTGCGMDLWHVPDFDEERDDLLARCPKPMRAGFSKATHKFLFTTSMGRSPDAWRFQVFAAATLTQVAGGLFHSLQTGVFNTGEEAVRLAAAEAAEMEAGKSTRLKTGESWKLRPFRTWKAALKDAVPEYTGA